MSLIEKVEEYWDNRPCNFHHSNKDISSLEFFDEVMKKKFFVEPHIIPFCDFEKYNGKKVLDLGCGLGTMAVNYAKHGAQVTCVDLSLASLKLCQKNFELRGLKGKFIHANAEQLSELDELERTFDLVFSFGVIHHSPSPQTIIDQIKLLLKPRGELKLMVYNRYSYKLFQVLNELETWNFKNVDTQFAKRSEAQPNCPVTHTFTTDSLELLLGQGFSSVSIHKDHIFKYDIEKYVNQEFVIDAAFRGMTNEEFREMEKELGLHLLVCAIASE